MEADVNDVFTIWYAGCENNNGGTLTATSVPKGTKIPLRNPQLGKYRKAAKTKSVFPSDQSLKKTLYLASENITKKRTRRYRRWDQVLNKLIVLYGERLTEYL